MSGGGTRRDGGGGFQSYFQMGSFGIFFSSGFVLRGLKGAWGVAPALKLGEYAAEPAVELWALRRLARRLMLETTLGMVEAPLLWWGRGARGVGLYSNNLTGARSGRCV